MITSQDRLEEYKKAVRLKYKVERNGDFSSFLFNPSRGKLRDLCMEIFKENRNLDDLKTFKLFFGFDYSLEHLNRLRDQKDKFRPIETFFKGETDLQDIEGINIAAILVNFEQRPFAKFRQSDFKIVEEESDTENNDAVISKPNTNKVVDVEDKKDHKKRNFFFWVENNKLIVVLLFIGSMIGGFSLSKFVFKEKECLYWEVDRYVSIDCGDEQIALLKLIIIQNDVRLVDFRKIPVDESTVFFSPDGRPLIWYCKMSSTQIDYFNSNGNGFHPVTGKKLNPISSYIINKYVKEK
jgi:hypothetical protein